MTNYPYPPQIALDSDTQDIAPAGSSGLIYASTDTTYTTPLAITDMAGVTLVALTAGARGFIPGFIVADLKTVVWKSGAYVVPLISFDGIIADSEAAVTAAAASAASAAAAAASTLPSDGTDADILTLVAGVPTWSPPDAVSTIAWDSVTGTPATFPPSSHTTAVVDLRGSSGAVLPTPVANLLSAADAAAARTAIGAGTGNGTSNLALGTTAGTAMAGNRAFAANEIGVSAISGLAGSTVQEMLGSLASRPTGGSGGGGSSDVVTVLWSGGAYPTQAATPPSGVTVRHFYGPVQYSGATWSGVLDQYTYAVLT